MSNHVLVSSAQMRDLINSKEGVLNVQRNALVKWIQSYRMAKLNKQQLMPSVATISANDSLATMSANDSLAPMSVNDSLATISANDSVETISANDSLATISANDSVENITFTVGKDPEYYLPKFPKRPFNLTLLGKYCVVRSNFNNNKYIHSIRFPDTLLRISPFAFYNCENLKDVYIGKNVNKIYDTAFKRCPNVYFHVSEENTKFASLNGMLFSKDYTKLLKGVPLLFNKKRKEFIGGNNLEVPNHPGKLLWDHITRFGSFAFPRTEEIIGGYFKSIIEMPPNLRSIGDSALDLLCISGNLTLKTPKHLNKLSSYLFKNLSNAKKYKFEDECRATQNINEVKKYGRHIRGFGIFKEIPTKIIISKSVNIISETAFDSFYGVVKVDKRNKHFSSENNAIFNKDKSTLLRYISLHEGTKLTTQFTVPYGVANIGDYAFYNTLVEEISIPETVRNIGVGVFSGCKNLKRINFSPNIKLRKFGTFNFYNCYINRCIEIMSSPKHKHWTDNNFGNIFLYAGSAKITNYVDGVGLIPDTKVIREGDKIVKNVFKTNKIDLNLLIYFSNRKRICYPQKSMSRDENPSFSNLYNETVNEYKKTAKELYENGEKRDETVKRKATIVAIIYAAVNSVLNDLDKNDFNFGLIRFYNYDQAVRKAFKEANNAIINMNIDKKMYNAAYNAAYNMYMTEEKYSEEKYSEKKKNKKQKNPTKNLNTFAIADGTGVMKNFFEINIGKIEWAGLEDGKNLADIRVKLKYRNKCIITNNRDYPLTSKTNYEIMDETCNTIVKVVKDAGFIVKGPISVPNNVLLKNFYANYHLEKKIRNNHPLISLSRFPARRSAHNGSVFDEEWDKSDPNNNSSTLTGFPNFGRKDKGYGYVYSKTLKKPELNDAECRRFFFATGGRDGCTIAPSSIYIIEPTKKTIELLTKFRHPVADIIANWNKDECEYIKIRIQPKNNNVIRWYREIYNGKPGRGDYVLRTYQLRVFVERKIIKIVNQNGALAVHGPLYGNNENMRMTGTNLLNSRYVDETTREIVKKETFINRFIDISGLNSEKGVKFISGSVGPGDPAGQDFWAIEIDSKISASFSWYLPKNG